MAKRPNQKMKIMYLRDYMVKYTDENHAVTMKDIMAFLDSLGIQADRKTIYSDIEELRQYGVDIITYKTTTTYYYVGQRDFELPELRILMDAVAQSKFLTEDKTKKLTDKLMSLCSVHEKKWLGGQLYIPGNFKSTNKLIYSNVYGIHQAIFEREVLCFKYWKFVGRDEKVLRNDGKKYRVEPQILTWNDGNYYLVAFDIAAGRLKTFRLDKMDIAEQESTPMTKFIEKDKLIRFINEQFSMFDGNTTKVTIEFDEELTGAILDKFGKNAALIARENGRTRVLCDVKTSSWFYSWMVGMGMKAAIVKPEEVKQEFCEYLNSVLNSYVHLEP